MVAHAVKQLTRVIISVRSRDATRLYVVGVNTKMECITGPVDCISMKKYLNLVLSLWVLWNLNPQCRDVLEFKDEITGTWEQIDGPYTLTPDGKDYKVPVPVGEIGFFRVRRDWGSPWL